LLYFYEVLNKDETGILDHVCLFSFAECLYSHGSNGEKPQKQRNLQTLFMSSTKEPYNRAKIELELTMYTIINFTYVSLLISYNLNK